MLIENKNLKDTNPTLLPPLSGEGGERLSYTKTHKLITALYMVTDMIDKEEPIRNKLRTLGIEILSDIVSVSRLNPAHSAGRPDKKIQEVLLFLDIASAIYIISEMNCAILKKEFLELKNSLITTKDDPRWLKEFFDEGFPLPPVSPHPSPLLNKEKGNLNSKGHTRIGVQKGSTLLKAIKDMSNRMSVPYEAANFRSGSDRINFDILKKQRRDNLINVIKTAGGNATIKDIKDKIKTMPEQNRFLVSCSEKTLQRELVSMVRDSVLNRTGEKRWSRYFIK